ncbi:MAG: type III-B CRISPR module RAMP protein Cmr1 [Candidatus Brockarchaeota archaeon]|nr:type III-B CRISPR module RAMP protein Cmr1 [Candidatus Brockarchaeota archaeon]
MSRVFEPEILRLRVKNITPTIIGGYKATTFSSELGISEGFRTQELKGVWRWWFRALLAGSIWDRSGGIDEEDVENIRERTESLLGSTKSSSKFILQVFGTTGKSTPPKGPLPPRLKILSQLTQDLDKSRYYDEGDLEYEIVLLERPYSNLSEDDVRVGVGSLITALIFQGIGAITRRGFGSLEIVNYKFNRFQESLKHYESFLDGLRKVTSGRRAENLFKGLIKDLHRDFAKFFEVKNPIIKSDEKGIPPFPIVSTDDRIFRFRVKEVSAESPMNFLNKLGNAVMKAQWKRLLGMPVEEANGRLHTWILGLPRGSTKHKHGYSISKRVFKLGRRPSAISLHALRRLGESWLCLIYGFLSRDWPYKSLYHVSPRKDWQSIEQLKVLTHKKQEQFSLECVFRTAFDMVMECLR